MLDAINLLSIVNSGEGYNAEFKVNIPTNMKSITEEVCRIFTVTLRRSFDFDKWVNKWVNKLTAKQIVVLKAIHANPKIKKAKLQELANLSSTAVDNNIEILKVEGLLERAGTKGGVWILHYILPKVGE
jgi:ATP-dependent DNA helicase RecG